MLHPIFRAIKCITEKPKFEVQNPITLTELSANLTELSANYSSTLTEVLQ